MKKIFAIICLISAMFACEDETRIPSLKQAPNLRVQLRAANSYFDISEVATTKLVYDVFSENAGQLESVDVYVTYQKNGSVCANRQCLGPLLLKSYTREEMVAAGGELMGEEIALADVLAVFGLETTDVGGGDLFIFNNVTTMTDGRVYPTLINGVSNVPVIYNQPGASYTNQFQAIIGCPFVQADAIGTYDIVQDEAELSYDFGGPDEHNTFEVIAGANANQIILKDVLGFGFDMAINVAAASGVATAPKQQTWNPQYWGFPASAGKGYTQVPSLSGVYSCAGQIDLRWTVTTDAANYGAWIFKAQKQN